MTSEKSICMVDNIRLENYVKRMLNMPGILYNRNVEIFYCRLSIIRTPMGLKYSFEL